MNTGRAVIGVAFVGVGALLLLDRAAVLDAGRVLADWWPLLFLVAAAIELLATPPRPVGAAVSALIGLSLLGWTTGLVAGSVLALLWPLALIAVGAWLLVRPRGPAADGDAQDAVDVTVLFAGRRIVSSSRDFRGGTATAIFGGIELDLTGARTSGGAELEAVALFGGVEVTVPPGWRVLLDGPAIFGGHENSVPAPADPDAPTLRVRATAIFGGVEVAQGAAAPSIPWPAPTDA